MHRAVTPQRRLSHAEPRELLGDHDRGRRHTRRRPRFERDPHVLAFEQRAAPADPAEQSAAGSPAQLDGCSGGPNPRAGGEKREHESGDDRIECFRAEHPGDGVRQEPEDERQPPPARH
jgi:hypothetical protein